MRRRLALLALATTTMVTVAFVVPMAVLVKTIAHDRARFAAELEAESLVPVLATIDDQDAIADVVDGLNGVSERRMSVIFPDGRVVGAPTQVDDNVTSARAGSAFSIDVPGGLDVLVPALTADETMVIRVFVPASLVRSGVGAAWAVLAGLGVVLVAVAVIVADRLGRNFVRTIDQLALVAQRLGQGDLKARFSYPGPDEVVEVGAALNLLATRIGQLLVAEREEVADLSHRLRTPVTALKLEAEGLRDPDEAARVAAAADDVARAVDRLINEARRPVRQGLAAMCDLAKIARERVLFWGALADDQGRSYQLIVPPGPITVSAHRDDIEAMLDALLGNVMSHTPEGVGFEVKVSRRTDGRAVLLVKDKGPGFPGEAVLERGVSGAGSTGLGLDIVRRTAAASGGAVVVADNAGGGACVEVTLASVAT